MAAVCCRHPDYDPEGGRALLGVRRAILGEWGSDRRERKLRRRTGVANDAGDGIGEAGTKGSMGGVGGIESR